VEIAFQLELIPPITATSEHTEHHCIEELLEAEVNNLNIVVD